MTVNMNPLWSNVLILTMLEHFVQTSKVRLYQYKVCQTDSVTYFLQNAMIVM